VLNNLAIKTKVTANQDKCSVANLQVTDGNDVVYFTVKSNGVSMYCQLLRRMMVDGVIKYGNFEFLPLTQELQIVIPFFWTSAVVDPNFSVLVDDNLIDYNQQEYLNNNANNCGKKLRTTNKEKIVIIGVVVGGVGFVVLLVIFVILVFPKYFACAAVKKDENIGIDYSEDL